MLERHMQQQHGTAPATPAYLAARCLDAFRAALRQWFYGETDGMATDALPRAPLSREPCTGRGYGLASRSAHPASPSSAAPAEPTAADKRSTVPPNLRVHARHPLLK